MPVPMIVLIAIAVRSQRPMPRTSFSSAHCVLLSGRRRFSASEHFVYTLKTTFRKETNKI